ncbi:MAG: hypothetical protein ACYCST_04570 [Acidimicrobiales bacterium]
MSTAPDRAPWKAPLSRIRPKAARPAPVVGGRKRTQGGLAVAMVLAAVVFAAGAAYFYSSATKGTSVLVATTPLAPGARVSPSDVTSEVVRLPSGMPKVSASFLGEIGRFYTKTAIEPGMMLVAGELTLTPPLKSAMVDVALVLTPSQYPATLTLGETVYAIYTGTSNNQSATSTSTPTPPPSLPLTPPTKPVVFNRLLTSQIIAKATVWQMPIAPAASGGPFSSSAPAASSNGDLDITVRVPPTFGPSLAAASAAGDVAIVTLRGAGS